MVKKSLIISLALIVPLLFFMGCAEDGKPVAPVSELSIKLVAGPTGEIPFNAFVTYQWQAIGGSGEYKNYTYTLTLNGSPLESGSSSTINTITFKDLVTGSYVFSVTVIDSKDASADVSRPMTVTSSTAVPVVAITQSPIPGSKVAENTPVTFAWQGDDPDADFGVITGYTFKLLLDTTLIGGTDEETYVKTITYESLEQGEYTFMVTAWNNALTSASDSTSFTVIPANVLWIDDNYLGSIPAEFTEYQEKVIQLDGFAWNEFDIMANLTGDGSTIPLLRTILNDPSSAVETVIWDANLTWGPFELWYATGDADFAPSVLAEFIDNGGNLVLIGNEFQDMIQNSNPPAEGDWEAVYQGIMTEQLMTVTSDTTDTLITDPDTGLEIPAKIITFDTTYTDPWEYWGTSYSGAEPMTGMNGYPNISVDIGKVDPNEEAAFIYSYLASNIKVINVDADGTIVSYIYEPEGGTQGKVVVIGLPLYFSPTQEYKDLIQKVLKEEFGL